MAPEASTPPGSADRGQSRRWLVAALGWVAVVVAVALLLLAGRVGTRRSTFTSTCPVLESQAVEEIEVACSISSVMPATRR